MRCTVTDLRYKDVINIKDGRRLGFVSDVEIDTQCAQVVALIIFGRCKFFGLFGREDDVIVAWKDIVVIGEDTILVEQDSTCHCENKKRPVFENLFK